MLIRVHLFHMYVVIEKIVPILRMDIVFEVEWMAWGLKGSCLNLTRHEALSFGDVSFGSLKLLFANFICRLSVTLHSGLTSSSSAFYYLFTRHIAPPRDHTPYSATT